MAAEKQIRHQISLHKRQDVKRHCGAFQIKQSASPSFSGKHTVCAVSDQLKLLLGMLWTVMFPFLFLSLPGIIYTAAAPTSISLPQIPEQVIKLRGTDISFHCVIPLSRDNSGVVVRWWKQGENEYLQTGADNRKRFVLKKKGGGFFELLNVTFQDSGIYHCAVIRQGRIIGNGTGSHLTVTAAPTPVKIVSSTSESNSAASLILVCETSEFYPGELTLVWYKNGVETATGVNSTKRQNTEGLYEVCSTLEETQPVPNGAVYICLVSHVSLGTPAIAIHTVANSNPESDGKYRFIWGFGCTLGGLALLVLMIIIGTRCSLKNEGKQESVTILDPREERGVKGDIVAYAALDLSKAKKTPRPEREDESSAYAQIKQVTARDKVTYATLELSGPEKAGKSKNNKISAEYAEIQTKTPRGVTEAVYTDARTK